jgi:hypothetical protein
MRMREVDSGSVRTLDRESDVGQRGLARGDDFGASGHRLTDGGFVDVHTERLDCHGRRHPEVDATDAGRRQRDATRQGGGHRRDGYEQPLLPANATSDAAVFASTAVATLRGVALASAAVGANDARGAVGVVAIAGHFVAGLVVAASPEAGESVLTVVRVNAMVFAGHCGRAQWSVALALAGQTVSMHSCPFVRL